MKARGNKMPTQKNNEVIDLLRQISEKQDAQLEKINAIHTKQEVMSYKLDSVETQTIKTNGRVSRHDTDINQAKGGLKVAYVLIFLLAIPVILAVLQTIKH